MKEEIGRSGQVKEQLNADGDVHRKLVENSLTGIYIDQDEKIKFANETFAEIYGYPLEELIGISSRELIHPDDRALTDQIRKKRLLAEEAPSTYEARGLKKNGTTIWVRRRNTQIAYQGKPAILGNIVDITEQKKAEEELLERNQELKSFIRDISHDLKTPIMSIRGFCSRLSKKYHDQLDEKGRDYLERIQSSAGRMEALVSDLRLLAKFGEIPLKLEDVSIKEVVDNVTSNLPGKLLKRRTEIVTPEELPVVYCDRDRIYQVFQNLLTNAIKFTTKAENPRVEIGYQNKGAFHQFYVRDNGIGVDPKYHQEIFEKFRRVKENGYEKGTGLGLAIVDSIVRDHGGKVWVVSEKGKGATFYFTLSKRLTAE